MLSDEGHGRCDELCNQHQRTFRSMGSESFVMEAIKKMKYLLLINSGYIVFLEKLFYFHQMFNNF